MPAPVGEISSVALFIVSVYLDIWSRLDALGKIALSAALVLLFLWDFLTVKVNWSVIEYER
jgi:hypothetical protein